MGVSASVVGRGSGGLSKALLSEALLVSLSHLTCPALNSKTVCIEARVSFTKVDLTSAWLPYSVKEVGLLH